MKKQDLNGVRTPEDVERRHNLGAIPGLEKDVSDLQEETIIDSQLSSSSTHAVENRVITANIAALSNNKVDKVPGKGLSTNDFSDNDKDSIHTHSNKTILDSITQSKIDQWNSNSFSIDYVYPIGSIYMSVNNTDPSTLFIGTTWQQIKDRFLLAAGNVYSGGSTGGEANHTLLESEMPSHTHNVPYIAAISPQGGGTDPNYGVTSVVYTQSSGSAGGGQSHNNMPPYLTVYMWKRVS